MKCRFCFPSTLNPNLVKGKIVLCDVKTNGAGAFLAGAVGALMADTLPKDSSRSFPLPASHLSARDGSSIANYINSTRYQLTHLSYFYLEVNVNYISDMLYDLYGTRSYYIKTVTQLHQYSRVLRLVTHWPHT